MKNKKWLSISLFAAVISPLCGCSKSNQKVTVLRVLNMEDYIYVQDIKNGYLEKDLIDQFEDYIASDEELSEKYGTVKVVYDTTDTNETLYSEMQTGKSMYDLMCPSDYMIQKLISYDMLVPFTKELVPNYFGDDSKCSPLLKETLGNIEAKNTKTQAVCKLEDYTVGYMWGTLGILFNPDYKKYSELESDIFEDASRWGMFTNQTYKGTSSIKDSMRDTFAIGTMLAYENDFSITLDNGETLSFDGLDTLRTKYASNEITAEEYNNKVSEIFNFILYANDNLDETKHAKNVVNTVKESMDEMKANSFGLECDSGKQDIVTGKIGINLAWSGDAVYSMDQAEDLEQVTEEQTLYYSLPETGANIWFDGWVIPKLEEGQRTDDQLELAHEFMNFMCDPVNVAQNMDYTGYTSFIGGDEILELVRDWYDMRTDEIYQEIYDEEENETNYYQIYAISDDINFIDGIELPDEEDELDGFFAIDYPDFISDTHDSAYNDLKLYYCIEDESGELVPIFAPVLQEDKTQKTYGDLTIVDEIEGAAIDLSYVFNGTLVNYDDSDCIFYDDEYAAYTNEDEVICVGRQFFCQYPDEKTMERCAVMRDYGKHNEVVVRMWEEFKSNTLPLWAIILFVIEIIAILGGVSYLFVVKYLKKKIRKNRKQAN